MMNYYSPMYTGWGWGSPLLMILFWLAAILFVVWLVKNAAGKNGAQEKSALEILKERYAKGEIDRKEFEERMKDIKNA